MIPISQKCLFPTLLASHAGQRAIACLYKHKLGRRTSGRFVHDIVAQSDALSPLRADV
jgi:hypothetical protein